MKETLIFAEKYTFKERSIRTLKHVGFSQADINIAFKENSVENLIRFFHTPLEENFSSNFLKVVADSFASEKFQPQRRQFLKGLFSNGLSLDIHLRNSTDSLPFALQKNTKLLNEFSGYIRYVFGPPDKSSPIRAKMLLFGSEVLQSNMLYSLFHGKIGEVIKFQRENINDVYALEVGEVAYFLRNARNGWMLLENKDKSFLRELKNFSYLHEILFHDELPRLIRDFLDSERGWADRLEFFRPIVQSLGCAYIRWDDLENLIVREKIQKTAKEGVWSEGELSASLDQKGAEAKERLILGTVQSRTDKTSLTKYLKSIQAQVTAVDDFKESAQIKRVRRRESIWHPLVSMGIAKTVGYEVEYPKPEDIYRFAAFQGMLHDVGFTMGVGGGENYVETSPGPFWDPLTANLTFGKYVDTGMVNFYYPSEKTMHFNVGIEKQGLTGLIRALYLTGYGINPKREFVNDNLYIEVNTKHLPVTFIECKVFDVVSRYGFEENMRAASYLSWALSAQQDIWKSRDTKRPWKKKLVDIWRNYRLTIEKGLDSIDSSDYLKTRVNRSPPVKKVMKQLYTIFDMPKSRLGDLGKISSEMNPEISIVKVEEKVWPNVAIFAREVTEKAVKKIEKIADDVEKKTVADIFKIEQLKGEERIREIGLFLDKYNYVQTIYNQGITSIDAYSKIKHLLLGNL